MKTAMAKVLRGGRSGASLLHAGGRRVPPEGGAVAAAAPLLPRVGATVPPPAAATRGMGGPGAPSQSLLQAAGRRMPQEGGLASLLPRLGVPPSPTAAAAGMGSGASSLSLFQAAGRRSPQKAGLVPLLPRLGMTVPCAMPWRFHQMAGLRSSAEAGEKIPHAPPLPFSQEYIASVQKLDEEIKGLESSINFLENMWWVFGILVLAAAVTLPEHLASLWSMNCELTSDLHATKEETSHLLDMVHGLKGSVAATSVAPAPVLPAPALARSTTASDQPGGYHDSC